MSISQRPVYAPSKATWLPHHRDAVWPFFISIEVSSRIPYFRFGENPKNPIHEVQTAGRCWARHRFLTGALRPNIGLLTPEKSQHEADVQ